MTDVSRLERRLAREKKARKTAEKLLEEKALELYEANQKLVQEVDVQSREAENANEQLEIARSRLWGAVSAMPDRFALYNSSLELIIMNEAYSKPFSEAGITLSPGMTMQEILRHTFKVGLIANEVTDQEAWIEKECARRASYNLQDIVVKTSSDLWVRIVERQTENGDILMLHSDITAEKKQQEALNKARKEAEDANRAKSTFLANMSHEIRTPMNGVIGMAELLGETELNSEQNLFATTIKSSAEALLIIINDILDYSKIEAGQMELFPEPFNLETTIKDVMMVLSSKAEEKNLDLLIDFDIFLPSKFVGDGGRIRQILLNLIGNAIKFTETGHVSVAVFGYEASDQSFDLRIIVEDSGIGIPEDKLDHVFGSFKQVDEAENRKFEGTGLGLAISKQLVELMGGEIWVESEYGVGTNFGFKLSLQGASEPAKPLAPSKERLGNVLVIDDTGRNREILSRQIKYLGLDVTTTDSAESGIQTFLGNPQYDCILVDHHMPERSGIIVAEELRAKGHSTPIVLMSGDTTLRGKIGSEIGPAGFFLQKPMLRHELENMLGHIFPAINAKTEVSPSGDVPKRPCENRSQGPALRLLLAEDNRTNQLVFKKMIKGLNVDLRIAQNGIEAVAAYQEEVPDAIITDISMPEMDGVEATQHIRALEKEGEHIPIYALTAHAMTGDKERFLRAGMDGYLTKPLKKELIHKTIGDFIAMRN